MVNRIIPSLTLACLSIFTAHAYAPPAQENASTWADTEVCRLLHPDYNTEIGMTIRNGVQQGLADVYGNDWNRLNKTEAEEFARARAVIEFGKLAKTIASTCLKDANAEAVSRKVQDMLKNVRLNARNTQGIYAGYTSVSAFKSIVASYATQHIYATLVK